MVQALGPNWIASDQVLPWSDTRSWLRYVVYSPPYGGDLLICRFRLGGAATWWHEGFQVGISDVTHWRIAEDHEQDFRASKAQLPGAHTPPPDAHALSELRRWWHWHCEHRGIDPITMRSQE
jgi:hypothetical protein